MQASSCPVTPKAEFIHALLSSLALLCAQGAVILSLLLLVLWLPPLVFSSGAPTYTTPAIQSVKLNVTITQVLEEWMQPTAALQCLRLNSK